MACIRKRRGKYVVDFRDGAGIRRWATCETRTDANKVLSEKLRGMGALRQSSITLAEFSGQWLSRISTGVKPRTLDSYGDSFRIHILPVLGNVKVQKLQRPVIKEFLASKLKDDLSGNTVRIINSALRACLGEAVEDNLIQSNPAIGMGKRLKLTGSKNGDVKAMDKDQLSGFLSKADSWYFPLFLLLARTGVRMGEAVALEISDVDFERGIIQVNKTYDFRHKTTDTPKTGKGREVDMSAQLATTLREMIAKRREKYFKAGKPMPSLLFASWTGTHLHKENVRRAFLRTLKRAELPLHFTPHCMRHTFASLLLQRGVSIAYVQRMLGHASIRLTVDLYGKWLPMGNRVAVDGLDDAQIAVGS